MGVPQAALGIDHRTIRVQPLVRQVGKDLRRSVRPTGVVERLAHDLPRRRIAEIGNAAIGRETDRVGDRDIVVEPHQFAVEIAVDRPGIRLRRFAHGADPEATIGVGAAIVGPGHRVIGLQRHHVPTRAAVDFKAEQRGFRGDQQGVAVDPARRRDMFIEPPFVRALGVTGHKPLAENIEPEELAPLRMPERTLAQRAAPIVEDLRHAQPRAAS